MSKELMKVPENLPAEIKERALIDLMDGAVEMDESADLALLAIETKGGSFKIGDNVITTGKELEVIIIMASKAFGYYHDEQGPYSMIPIPEGFRETIPVCWSTNGRDGSHGKFILDGDVNIFNKCTECHFNEFETAVDDKTHMLSGGGKACSQKVQLVVLRDEQDIPNWLRIPVTSRRNYSDYVTGLKGYRVNFFGSKIPGQLWMVKTKISLREEKSGKQKWTVLEFSGGEKMEIEEHYEKISKLREMVKPLFRKPVSRDDETPTDVAYQDMTGE